VSLGLKDAEVIGSKLFFSGMPLREKGKERNERTKWVVVMSEFAPICICLAVSLLVSVILLGLNFWVFLIDFFLFFLLHSFPLVKNIPKRLLLHFEMVFLFFLYKSFVFIECLWMDELFRAVSQFLPDAPGGMSGGFNQPSAPEGSSGLPFLIDNDNPDRPGPSLEREGRAVRDCTPELRVIDELQKDGILGRNSRQMHISIERIMIYFKEYIIPGNHVSDSDIRYGVEAYLEPTMQTQDPYLRKRKILEILRDLTNRGSESSHFIEIIKQIEYISGGPL